MSRNFLQVSACYVTQINQLIVVCRVCGSLFAASTVVAVYYELTMILVGFSVKEYPRYTITSVNNPRTELN